MAATGDESSAAARLRSVAELEILHTRLGQFVPSIQAFMHSVDSEMREAFTLLDERRRHWMRQRDILTTEQKAIQSRFELARQNHGKPRAPREPSTEELTHKLGEILRYQKHVDRQIQVIAANRKELDMAERRFRAKAGQIIIWTSEIAPKARHYLQRTIAKVGWYTAEGWDGRPVPRRRVGQRQTMHFPGLCARAILNRELRRTVAESTDETITNLHANFAKLPLFDVSSIDGVGAIVVFGLRAAEVDARIVEKYISKWRFLTENPRSARLRMRTDEMLATQDLSTKNPVMYVPDDHIEAIAKANENLRLKPLGKTAAEIAKLVFE
ncbi:MAG: hypothetical protein ACI8W8_000847 [Rhodothermales bacterium]|jgi:hypothetical protein